jgi:hypothetical protein
MGSPQREDKTSKGRRTDAQPGCSSSGLGRSSPGYRVNEKPGLTMLLKLGIEDNEMTLAKDKDSSVQSRPW